MATKNDALARKEHEAVRDNVGYYDFTHQLLQITGKDAPEFVDYLFVAPLSNAPVGKAKYTTMLNEEGKIIDDVIVFRMDEDVYNVSTLFIKELMNWIDKHKNGYEIAYEDITPENTMFAVQGPNSLKVLNDLLDNSVDDLKHFDFKSNTVGDIDVNVARSGYTGELGYELYVSPKQAKALEEKLVEAGQKYGMENITTDVIVTSLPREKGYVLMSDLEGLNPLEAGYGWSIGWKKDFIGKDHLNRDEKPQKELLGFVVKDDVEIEPKDKVYKDGEEVGYVTLYTYSFTNDENIGFAVVDTDKTKIGDTVEIGEEKIPTQITERIFYDKDNKRI